MTYKDNFVVEVKCRGKILRIKEDTVSLPFGSEYSLLLKNLDSRRASVKIHIDGQDILDYSSLILNGNSSTELEGFLSGNVAKNKFKFINKTKEIQDHRGDKLDDGLIRVEFAFEKPFPEVKKQIINEEHHHHHHHHEHHEFTPIYHWWPQWTYNSNISSDGTKKYMNDYTLSNSSGDVIGSSMKDEPTARCFNVQEESLGVQSLGQPLDDEGITVKGSECNQQFMYGSVGELEQSKVIVIKMKGITNSGTVVQDPVTVSTKLECPSCGRRSKSSAKFCSNCGTFLE